MPISIALLFCIPIGLGLYYEGRWLIRKAIGRWSVKERRGALAFGILGGLLIPMVYCDALAEGALSGKLHKSIVAGMTFAIGASIAGLSGWVFVKEKKEGK